MPRRQHAAVPPPTPRCLITLDPLPVEGYSKKGLRDLVGGRGSIPNRLDFVRTDVSGYRLEKMKRMSISGMQDKISLMNLHEFMIFCKRFKLMQKHHKHHNHQSPDHIPNKQA